MDSSNQSIVTSSQPDPSAVAVSPSEPNALQEQGTAPDVPPAPQRRDTTSLGSDVVSSLQSLMGTIVIAIFVITFVVQAFQIPSESMERSEEQKSELKS